MQSLATAEWLNPLPLLRPRHLRPARANWQDCNPCRIIPHTSDGFDSTMTMPEDAYTALETESTVSEHSAAIVSVYNSWTTASECASFYDKDDSLLLECARLAVLPERAPMDSQELLQELKKRCREEDIP